MKHSAVLAIAFSATVLAGPFPNDDQTIAHVLNRVAFGPRSGDVDRIREVGLQRYVELQLHPERIPDTALSARLAGLTTVGLSSREIAERFERPVLEMRRAKKQGDGKPSPEDKAMRQQA